jgi:hypothetical protein
MKKYNDSSFSHLILKNQNNLGNPLSIQSNLRMSGFTQPGPILKWVVILLDPIILEYPIWFRLWFQPNSTQFG